MLAFGIALLAVGAGIGIHIEEVQGLANEEVVALASKLKVISRDWTGEPRVMVDDLLWAECAREDRCLGEIRARMGCDDILLLRLHGGPTRIRLFAELHPADPAKIRRLILDISHGSGEWEDALSPLVQDFFSRAPAARTSSVAIATSTPALVLADLPRAEREDLRDPPWPWIAIGGGVLLGAITTLLAVNSNGVRSRLFEEDLSHDELDELNATLDDRELAMGLLAGGAVVAISTGILLLVLD